MTFDKFQEATDQSNSAFSEICRRAASYEERGLLTRQQWIELYNEAIDVYAAHDIAPGNPWWGEAIASLARHARREWRREVGLNW